MNEEYPATAGSPDHDWSLSANIISTHYAHSRGGPDRHLTLSAASDDEPIIIVGALAFSSSGSGSSGGGSTESFTGPRASKDPNRDSPPPPPQNCGNSNEITLLQLVDGAKYYVPDDISAVDLNSMANAVTTAFNTGGKEAAISLLYHMYETPSNANFADFKDWGTASGPTGSIGAGSYSYFSTSLQRSVTTIAFEPFGNYWFGALCALAHFSYEETLATAALTQSGRMHEIMNAASDPIGALSAIVAAGFYGDDPQDRPFVTAGFTDGQKYLIDPNVNSKILGVDESACVAGR